MNEQIPNKQVEELLTKVVTVGETARALLDKHTVTPINKEEIINLSRALRDLKINADLVGTNMTERK